MYTLMLVLALALGLILRHAWLVRRAYRDGYETGKRLGQQEGEEARRLIERLRRGSPSEAAEFETSIESALLSKGTTNSEKERAFSELVAKLRKRMNVLN